MKKYIFKIVSFCAVFAFFGCSSGEYLTDSEVSFDELKNMEGRNSGSITVITQDTTIKSILNWSVNDSAITFCDYYGEDYLKKRSSYHISNLGDLEKKKYKAFKIDNYQIDNFPQLDTLPIPFKSIQKIKYSGPSIEGSGSNDESLSPRGGVEINSRKKELTLALLTEAQIDFYRMVDPP